MNDAELARNYILDRLSDEDRDECERRFLFDPEFETTMLEQERALLDDYVNLRLSGEDAEAVLRRVAQEPGHLYRLRIAEGLKRAAETVSQTAESNPSPSLVSRWRALFAPRNRAWFGGLAAAAALAIVAAVSLNLRHRAAPIQPDRPLAAAPAPANPPAQYQDGQHAKPSIAPPPRQMESNAASMATFVLLASEQRGAGDGTEVVLKPGIETLRLQLTTEEGLESGRYTATVADSHEATVFSAGGLATRTEGGRRYVDLRIPSARLAAGAYTVDLARSASDALTLSFHFNLATAPATK